MAFNVKLLALCLGFLHVFIDLTNAQACSDVQNWCSYWKDAGYCASSHRFYNYMKTNCKKTCGFCRVNPCEKIPCKNGGTCIPNGDNFRCQCKVGYEGNTCETVDPCARQPCKNGGTCTRQGNAFSCECADGFDGNTCENKVVTKKDCKNTENYDKDCPTWKKAGFCKAGNKWYGFMGDHCAKECGFCKLTCVDEQSADYCNTYKQYCKHPQYGSIISKSCKKTCNACDGSDPPCGQGPNKLDRVVGGVDAQPNDWPWQALLKSDGRYYCGGTLIKRQWVLTAGHCLRYKTKEQLGVVLGEHIRSKVEGPEQSFKVIQIVRHPDYNPETKDSDIALLKLDREATLNKNVSLACLPTEPPTHHQTCWITGWGRTKGLGEKSDILQEAKLRTVTNKECSVLNTSPTVTENMLCAGYGLDFSRSQSGCQGDSGGPLVCKKGLKWYVHGAVSWGSSRCISGESYTVFARVTKFTDWIKSTTD